MKFEIKSRLTGAVLFSAETESLKLAVEMAVGKQADLRKADLREANLRGANLREADLWGAYLWGADLRGAYLWKANLWKADLWGADLWKADLRGADLRGADLREANLREANLWGANLREANLREANLRKTDLREANLRGADLRGAYLSGADLREAYGVNKYLTTPLYFLHDQVGKIRLYKLTKADGTGPYYSSITYEIGKTYTEKEANCDEQEQCAPGISLATLDWCIKEWKDGYRIFIAEFTAKDIACIPISSDGKFRVRKCKIVAEKNLKEIGLINVPVKRASKKS